MNMHNVWLYKHRYARVVTPEPPPRCSWIIHADSITWFSGQQDTERRVRAPGFTAPSHCPRGQWGKPRFNNGGGFFSFTHLTSVSTRSEDKRRTHFRPDIACAVEHVLCMWQRPETELHVSTKVAEPAVCVPAIDASAHVTLLCAHCYAQPL